MSNPARREKSVALSIRVVRGCGVTEVKIFGQGDRVDAFGFYYSLLPVIEQLSLQAQFLTVK